MQRAPARQSNVRRQIGNSTGAASLRSQHRPDSSTTLVSDSDVAAGHTIHQASKAGKMSSQDGTGFAAQNKNLGRDRDLDSSAMVQLVGQDNSNKQQIPRTDFLAIGGHCRSNLYERTTFATASRTNIASRFADKMKAADFLQEKCSSAMEPTLLSYLKSYLSDPDTVQKLLEDDAEELESFIVPALEDSRQSDLTELVLSTLKGLLLVGVDANQYNQGAKLLDHAIDLSIVNNRTLVASSVDIASTTKARSTQVDIGKLEKAEAKLRVKSEKRAKKTGMDLYQGSKLLEAQKKQKEYEELYMAVNSLDTVASKGKSKDIHLENIDVSFGSLRILAGGHLTLAHGRRYGLIGRNGIGKTTLLKQIAVRELPIPSHISILYVDQEAHGDDTKAIDCILQADVWRERLYQEQAALDAALADSSTSEKEQAKAGERLGEVHQLLVDIDAETGPARAAELLFGLGFTEEDQQRPTRTFSGGWRMRLSLARALFVKPDLLLLDEPSNNLDLVAIAWLEDYLANHWQSTVLVVSHDRAFLDRIATDIVHQHSKRLDYYKGNFAQFYATKAERALQQRREYDAQQLYRAGLQAFIDRWRYNANRAAQAQSKIKILEKLPDLEPPEDEASVKFTFEEADKLSPPVLQLDEVSFAYSTSGKTIVSDVNLDIGLESRLGLIGPNGAGKSTLLKLLIGELNPDKGKVNRNGRLRIAYFAQHQVDALELDISPVAYLAQKFPGRSEQQYRSKLGAFGITGLTGLQIMSTLSGGQKSRVAFAILSMQQPHLLIIDEPTNHLDVEAHELVLKLKECSNLNVCSSALADALNRFTGGVLVVSHDERFITNVCKELWVVADGKCKKHYGDVSVYKNLILANAKMRPT